MAVAYLSELVFVASVALLGRRARHLTSLPALNGVSGVLTGIVYEQRKDDVLNEERMRAQVESDCCRVRAGTYGSPFPLSAPLSYSPRGLSETANFPAPVGMPLCICTLGL